MRLILLVLASIVPLIVFTIARRYFDYQESVASISERNLALARSMALLVDDELQTRVVALRVLSRTITLQTGDVAGFRQRAEAIVAEEFPGANMIVLREDGQQLMNTLLPPDAPPPIRPNLETVRQVFATGQPAVSNLYRGAIGARPVVAIDVPVKHDDGRVLYVLSINPRLDDFADIIRRQHPPPGWVVSVFDRQGVNVARTPNPAQFVGREASPSLLPDLLRDREGVVETTSLEGTPLLTVFSRAEHYGWSIAIGVPRTELTVPALDAALRAFAVGVGLLVIGLGLAVAIARRITGPIRALRRLAAADESSPLDPAPTGLREADEVAEALRVAHEERRRSQHAAAILHDGIETIPEGFAIYDDQDRLVMCNTGYRNLAQESAARGLGARYEDVLRDGVASGLYPDSKGREEAFIAERLIRHRNPTGPVEQPLADGRWLLVRKRRMSNGWIASLRIDITALKAAQRALEESERSFQYLFESSPLPKWVFDLETLRFLAVNDAAIGVYGYSREEFLAMRITDIRPQEDTDRFLRRLNELGPSSQSSEWRHRLKDGRIIDVDVFSHSLTFGGRPARMAIALDVTARRAAHAMNQRIFETAADLILVADRQGTIIQASPSLEAILGYRPDQWIGRSAAAFVYPDDLESVRAEMRAGRRGRLLRTFETRYVHRDGRVVRLAWSGVWSEPDQRHFFTGRDMTERLVAEEQLRHAQKMEAVGQLTGGLAHDFNNLLLVVMGNLGLLRDMLGGNRDADELVREAHDAARRGADLTKSLLAFARRQPLQPRRSDVNALVTEITTLLRRTLGERVEIALDLAPTAWPAVVDPIQLEAALANLATNARDAMPKGGRLSVVTANRQLDADYASQHPEVAPGDYVMLQVSDTGTGMPPDVLARVFEPFFTTKERGEGTGLGLAMVFGFMKQSGGHINVYSEVGVGTTFRLYLPRDRGAVEAAQSVGAALVPLGRGERVLVVEDNDALRRLVVRQLGQLGYRSEQAENSAAALTLLEERGQVDLLFTDVVMAGKVDGFDLARIVAERWPQIRILMTSGFPGTDAHGHADPLPNVRLLGKPYQKEDLARAMREALDGQAD
ncbi:MAG: PAS domain S-box protein [Proteobacteria bacterium]|nr:PAS domain S-box protein [Pseudomonadota bacterium]